jgi:hypothetical protein
VTSDQPARGTIDVAGYAFSAILNAYDFDHDHLYEFSYRNRYGVEESAQHPSFEEGPWKSKVRVGDVPLQEGGSMTFLYDFGARWAFTVTLEAIEPPGEAPEGPSVLETRGEAPEQYPDWGEEDW